MKDNGLEDVELVQRSIEGREEAYKTLVQKYYKRIISIIYQMIGNKHDAEDIAQEVFIKVFYKLKDYNPKYTFYTWLYRIAINKCYDHLRITKRKKTRSFTELNRKEVKMINTLFAQKTEERGIIYNKDDIEEVLNKLLLKLKPKEKAVIAMRDIENLPYKDISNILHCSELAARLKVSRARKKLRSKFEEYLVQKN